MEDSITWNAREIKMYIEQKPFQLKLKQKSLSRRFYHVKQQKI